MVSHRVSDCEHSRKEQGDVERESDDANKAIDKVRPTFQDIVHRRVLFVQGTEKMKALHSSPSWPPAEYQANVVESQEILLSRRIAAQLSHFLLTHIPPLRDEAGHMLVWNRHLKASLDKRQEKVYQYRRIGDRPSKTIPLSRQTKSDPKRAIYLSIFDLPQWLGQMMEDYVDNHLPRLTAEAVRKGQSVAVPNARDGKNEMLMFPGWDASYFGKQVRRVSGASVTDVRALVEEELNQHKEQWQVPDALIENLCGHTMEVTKKHYKTPTYLKNMHSLVERLHDTSMVLWNYQPRKLAPRGRAVRNKREAMGCDSESESVAALMSD